MFLAKAVISIKGTIFYKSFTLLPRQDKIPLIVIAAIQIVLNFFDLVGIAIIGLIGSLAVRGVQSIKPSGTLHDILVWLNLDGLSFQYQAAVLGTTAALLMVFKTFASIYLNRKAIYFLSRRSAVVSSHLMSKLLSQSLLDVQKKTVQEHLYAMTQGVSAVTLGIVGVTVMMISDVSLMLIIFIGLVIVDPVIALFSATLFTLVGFVLYQLMHKKAHQLGMIESKLNIKSSERIVEVLSSYRESLVRNRRSHYAKEVGTYRLEISNTLAELSLMPNISKYIVESTLIVASVCLCAIQFSLYDAVTAVSTIAIFIASSSRLAPAALRTQQAAIQIVRSIGAATPTLDMMEDLRNSSMINEEIPELNLDHKDFEASIDISNLYFKYPGELGYAIENFRLKVREGDFVAIVGLSGAGKSTIVDLLLGVLKPDDGSISISGKSPIAAIEKWPGAIAYVPQDVMVINGSIRENIAMGFPETTNQDGRIWEILKDVDLFEFVSSKKDGLNFQVGERGSLLSGGQRQRLGIARSLYTEPKLIVLDEATSSLDGESEEKISKSFEKLKSKATIIVIAHRLSSIRKADRIVYVESGKVLAEGTFDLLKAENQSFRDLASTMGL
jgi:ABC-type multidrug transport system fused ATPase/permease subunit